MQVLVRPGASVECLARRVAPGLGPTLQVSCEFLEPLQPVEVAHERVGGAFEQLLAFVRSSRERGFDGGVLATLERSVESHLESRRACST